MFFVCFYVCFFDCKCKRLKILGENINKNNRNKHKQQQTNSKKYIKTNRNTAYPAHEPPRINRTNYSWRFVGWIYCISVLFMCFFEFLCFVVMFLSVVCLCFRLVFLSFCIYNRKNTYNNIS